MVVIPGRIFNHEPAKDEMENFFIPFYNRRHNLTWLQFDFFFWLYNELFTEGATNETIMYYLRGIYAIQTASLTYVV